MRDRVRVCAYLWWRRELDAISWCGGLESYLSNTSSRILGGGRHRGLGVRGCSRGSRGKRSMGGS